MNYIQIVKFVSVLIVFVHYRMKFTVKHTTYFNFYDPGWSWREVIINQRIFPDTPFGKDKSQIAIVDGWLIWTPFSHQCPYDVIQVRIVGNTKRFIRTIVKFSAKIFCKVWLNLNTGGNHGFFSYYFFWNSFYSFLLPTVQPSNMGVESKLKLLISI